MQSEERKCMRQNITNGWECFNIALSTSIYCENHHKLRDVRNERRRKYPNRQSVLLPYLPSGDLRCRKTGGLQRWQCNHKAAFGALFCHKHRLAQQKTNKRKGPPAPHRTLIKILSLNHSGNANKTSGNTKKTYGNTKKQTPAAGRKCRRWRCQEIASPGIYCETHQLELNSKACGGREASSSSAVKPARGATKRKGARKRLREKETTSADLVLGEVSVIDEHEPIATPSMPVAPSQSTTSLPPTASSSPGILRPSKSITSMGMPRQHSYNTRFGSALNIETLVAAAEQRDAPIEESGWVGTQRTASPDNQPTSDSNMEITSREATMNLQENEGLSFDTDGAMNAVDFSFAQMEAEEDVMDVLAVHSTVYVGDIPIPAEYEQIYKEIKDLHGPLENGESVCGERSLSHETLIELLKVAHELEGLTMESMTETTISNFKRIVAIGKLFHYNVGWLDEHLKCLSDVYAKCCAVGGELEQVERKITEKKHEEDMLKLEVDEIDENIRVLEESINKMKQKQESTEMEKKKKYSIVSSLQERILETSERICDTEVEFYRIAAKPW